MHVKLPMIPSRCDVYPVSQSECFVCWLLNVPAVMHIKLPIIPSPSWCDVYPVQCHCQRECFVCWIAQHPSNMRVYVRDGSAHNFTCCHTEIEVADQTFHLTQSQYTDNRPTSPSTDPITPGAWQGSHWSANF